MVRNSTRNLLAVYLLGMTLVHGAIFWQVRGLIGQGFPDFSIFYTAGMIVGHGQGVNLYDEALQNAVARSFATPAATNRGSIIPYYHPPFEAVLFAPLSALPFKAAYWSWVLFNLGLLAALPFVLRPHLRALGQLPWWFWFIGCLAFSPNFSALSEGQDSVLILFAYSAAFAAMNLRADFRAGTWLGLGLCKYQLVLPFLIPLVIRRSKQLVAGFFGAGAILFLIGAAAVGWKGWASYPRFVWYADNTSNYIWNAGFGNTPNLRGLVFSLVSGTHPEVRRWLLVAASIAILSASCAVVRKLNINHASSFQLGFALNLLGTLLVSYHSFSHDLCLLWLVILLTLDSLLCEPLAQRTTSILMYGCMAVFYFSPLYLVVLLRYGQLYWFTWILLLFFALLWVAVRADRRKDGKLATSQDSSPVTN